MGTLHHIVLAGLTAAGEASGAKSGGILSDLGIQYPLIIAQAFGFLLLLIILRAFLYKPILGMLDAREEEIRTRYTDAEKARGHAEQLRHDYEARLAQADTEARDRIQDGVREGQAMRAELIAQAHEDRERIVEQGHREITDEREKMLYTVRDKVATMAVDAAGRIISKSVDAETHRELINEFLEELPGEAGEARS
ncbi:MAG TPA: F0F1 ATP synthase subunit B [Armatimonadota bacterium]|nr:F0F1 ATP synthase subunit B [Armatimonadota bacterium]